MFHRRHRPPGGAPIGPRAAFTACLLFALLLLSAIGGRAVTTVPGVAFEQQIGNALPLDVPLHDETGRPVTLREYFNGEVPVVVMFGYSRCPQLCSVIANATVETLRNVRAATGTEYRFVYLSIDPTDGPRELSGLKERDERHYGRPGAHAAWHYVGGDAAAIRSITAAAGFHFTYDERQRLYAHPSGFLVATPSGLVSQYFLGLDYDAKEVATALRTAAQGRTGNPVYQLLLVCARGLGIAGRYGPAIWLTLEIAVGLTLLAVFGGIGIMLWQERRGRRPSLPQSPALRPNPNPEKR